MADEVIVRLRDVENAVLDGLSSSRELRRAAERFIEDAADIWRLVWDTSRQGILATETGVRHPYQTGNYREHIKTKNLTWTQKLFIKKALRGGLLVGSVYNDSRVANWVEFGTDVDKPGSKSPWGPNTPTPAFRIAERTAQIMSAGGFIER